MKLNNRNSKTIGIIIGIILFIAVAASVTYAVYKWTTNNTNIAVTTKCFNITGSGQTVSGSDLYPYDEKEIINTAFSKVTFRNGMIKVPFTINGNTCDIDTYFEIKINVTYLDDEYANGALKYVVAEYVSGAEKIGTEYDYDPKFKGFITDEGTFTIYRSTIAQNATAKPRIFFYLDGDLIGENSPGIEFDATFEVVANQGEYVDAADYITDLYTNATKSTATVNSITYNLAPSVGLMNDRLGSMGTDINGGNIRYYGEDPDNYVWLGDSYTSDVTFEGTITGDGYSTKEECIRENGEAYCTEDIVRHTDDKKLWRIIGVFDGRLKLITADPISTQGLSWDTSASGINNGNGINQWGPSNSYEGADLMRLLNPGYTGTNSSLYWNKTSGTVYTGRSDATTASISFANTGLSQSEKDKIDTAVWYLGASASYSYVNVQYAAERQDTTLGKICSLGTYCNDTVERTSTWNGKVGLMYPSDYGYATDLSQCSDTVDDYASGCYLTDWLRTNFFEWTISPYAASDANYVFSVDENGNLCSYAEYIAGRVRPAVYLKSGLKISDGAGTESDPYVLS